jgi:nucleoside phosphorylase
VAAELTCVLFALDREAMFFCRGFSRRQAVMGMTRSIRPAPCRGWLGKRDGREVLVLVTGMGGEAALGALDWALHKENPIGRICRVISAGFCGALVETLAVGSLIQPECVIDADGIEWPIAVYDNPDAQGSEQQSAPLIARSARQVVNFKPDALARGQSLETSIARRAFGGRLATVAAAVLTPDERHALYARTGAIAVDMETAWLARRCREKGIEFTCLRAVSDGMGAPLSPALAAALESDTVNLWRLARALLRRPSLFGELRRLGRDSRSAAAVLAEGLSQLLAQVVTSP